MTVPQPQVGTTAQANGNAVPQSVQHGDGNHAHGLFGLFGNRQPPVPPQYRDAAGGSMPPEQTPSLGTTVQHFKQVGDPAQLNDFANFVRHEAPKPCCFGIRRTPCRSQQPAPRQPGTALAVPAKQQQRLYRFTHRAKRPIGGSAKYLATPLNRSTKTLGLPRG
ncbi:MAG: hypothetical protein R2857_12770 [Vampirovibrionales bacterium]